MREIIKLVSTAGTGHFYTTEKNPQNETSSKKMKIKKYDRKLRRHVEFKEEKIKG